MRESSCSRHSTEAATPLPELRSIPELQTRNGILQIPLRNRPVFLRISQRRAASRFLFAAHEQTAPRLTQSRLLRHRSSCKKSWDAATLPNPFPNTARSQLG